MSFTGEEDHEISFEEGAIQTKRYRDNAPSEAINGFFFGKKAVEQLLTQDGCVGIRIYFGLTEEKIQSLILVGVSENEDDQINSESSCMDLGVPCPSQCGAENILNS